MGVNTVMAETTYLRSLVWTPEEPKVGFFISLYGNLSRLNLFLLLEMELGLYFCGGSEMFD